MNQHINPDDRSDNAEKLQEMIQNTEENIEKAEASMAIGNEQDRKNIAEKNRRREESIAAFKEELKDEM